MIDGERGGEEGRKQNATQVKMCYFIVDAHTYAGSMVFNDDGRYYDGGDYLKMVYGAFSGPT